MKLLASLSKSMIVFALFTLSLPADDGLALSNDGSVLYMTGEGGGVFRPGTP